MNPRSVRIRLVGWCVGLALLAFIAFTAYTYVQVQLCLRANLETLLKERADRIGKFLLQHVSQTGEAYVANEIVGRYSPGEDLRFIRIFRPDGTTLYLSDAPKKGEFNPARMPTPTGNVTGPSSQQLDFSNGFHMVLVTEPYLVGDQKFVIQCGETAMRNRQVLWALIKALLLFLPVFIIVTVGGIYFLIGKTLASVDRLTTAAQEITQHNLSLRLPETNSGDELERLTQAFNEMICRLNTAFQHASRFSMDASHELRTPLAIIQGELEVIIHETREEENREKMYSLLEEVRHLSKIVNHLFAISRLEAGEAVLDLARVDLTSLVHRVEEQMAVLAEEKSISIHWEKDAPVFLDGDGTRLKQVVVNLLDNAIKYTPPSGRVELAMEEQGDKAIFTVTNSGSRISDETLPYLFDRFFRSQTHRLAHRDGGAGLGLSIVRSICSAHGGTVSVTNEEGGCSFRVELPCVHDTIK